MKNYTIRRTDTNIYADLTQSSSDPDFKPKIPGNNAGYRDKKWFTQLGYESLGLNIVDKLDVKIVVDVLRQELDIPIFEDILSGLTAVEQEVEFRASNEIITVDSVEKYVVTEQSHTEYQFPKNYEIIVEDVIEPPAWEKGREKRYKRESDPLFIEAVREKFEGDDTKWIAYMAIVNNIKAEFIKV